MTPQPSDGFESPSPLAWSRMVEVSSAPTEGLRVPTPLWRQPNMVAVHAGIPVETAAAAAKQPNPNTSPQSMDYLKVDIDGCDCHVLENVGEERLGRPAFWFWNHCHRARK